MKNHIEEYFANQNQTPKENVSKELFKGDKDIDLKTELEWREITLISILKYNNDMLVSHGLKPAWNNYLNDYMRLKVSLKRKSREEFVSMHKNDNTDETLEKVSNISNIMGAKK